MSIFLSLQRCEMLHVHAVIPKYKGYVDSTAGQPDKAVAVCLALAVPDACVLTCT